MGNPTTVDLLEKINRLVICCSPVILVSIYNWKKKRDWRLFTPIIFPWFVSFFACMCGWVVKVLSCFILQFFMAHILMCCSSFAGWETGMHKGGQCWISACNSDSKWVGYSLGSGRKTVKLNVWEYFKMSSDHGSFVGGDVLPAPLVLLFLNGFAEWLWLRLR